MISEEVEDPGFQTSWRAAFEPSFIALNKRLKEFGRDLEFRSRSALVSAHLGAESDESLGHERLVSDEIQVLKSCCVGVVIQEAVERVMTGIIVSPSRILLSEHFGEPRQADSSPCFGLYRRSEGYEHRIKRIELHFFLGIGSHEIPRTHILIPRADTDSDDFSEVDSIRSRGNRLVVTLSRESIQISKIPDPLKKGTEPGQNIRILHLPETVLRDERVSCAMHHFAILGCKATELFRSIDLSPRRERIRDGIRSRKFTVFEGFPLVGVGLWDSFDPREEGVRVAWFSQLLGTLWDDKNSRRWLLHRLGTFAHAGDGRREYQRVLSDLHDAEDKFVGKVRGTLLRDLLAFQIEGWEFSEAVSSDALFSAGIALELAPIRIAGRTVESRWMRDDFLPIDKADFPILTHLLEARKHIRASDRARFQVLFDQFQDAAVKYALRVKFALLTLAGLFSHPFTEGMLPYGLCLSDGLLALEGFPEMDTLADCLASTLQLHVDMVKVIGFSGGPVISFRGLRDRKAVVVVGAWKKCEPSAIYGTTIHHFVREIPAFDEIKREVLEYFGQSEEREDDPRYRVVQEFYRNESSE